MLENIIKSYCERNKEYCTFIPNYKGDMAIQIQGEYAFKFLIGFFSHINDVYCIYNPLEIILDMQADQFDTPNKYIIVYFKENIHLSKYGKDDLIDDSIAQMATNILNNTDFDNWREQSIANITKLCLENLAIGNSLAAVAKGYEIKDEILSIIESNVK